jgi:hypothetical protein
MRTWGHSECRSSSQHDPTNKANRKIEGIKILFMLPIFSRISFRSDSRHSSTQLGIHPSAVEECDYAYITKHCIDGQLEIPDPGFVNRASTEDLISFILINLL